MQSENYSLKVINSVTIVYAEFLSLALMSKLMRGGGRHDVLDIALANRIGAILAFGSATDLAVFRKTNPPAGPVVLAEIARAKSFVLSEAAIAWLDGYDRGASSNALFAVACFPLKILDLHGPALIAAPHDDADFGRCQRLMQLVPEVASGMHKAAGLSPEWAVTTKRLAQSCIFGAE